MPTSNPTNNQLPASQFAKKENEQTQIVINALAACYFACWAIAACVPPRETQVAVKHLGPKPLRPNATGLCEERLALAHRDCQSRKGSKIQDGPQRIPDP